MPALTHSQHLAGLAAAPAGAASRRPISPPDPPDLRERWLECVPRILALDRVSGSQLEACRIGLAKWVREGDREAIALDRKISDHEKRAWHARG